MAKPTTEQSEIGHLATTLLKPNPLVGTRYETSEAQNMLPKAPVDVEQHRGSSVMLMPWDSTSRNVNILGVSGHRLANPVTTHGGHDYARDVEHAQQGVAGASGRDIAKRIQTREDYARKENEKAGGTGGILHLPVTMGERAEDFSLSPTQVLHQLHQQAKLSKSEIKRIDEEIRSHKIKGAPGQPMLSPFKGFVGMRHPGFHSQITTGHGIETTPGELRKAIVDRLYLKNNQKALGFNAPDVVNAVTDPALRGVPKGFIGNTVIGNSPNGMQLSESGKAPYDTNFSGVYHGTLGHSFPAEVLLGKRMSQLQNEFAGQRGDPRTMSLGALEKRNKNVSQILDNETLDNYAKFMQNRNKLIKTGHYAEGGTVTPTGESQHDTTQEGPFLRIRPRHLGPNEARPSGVLEASGQNPPPAEGSPRDITAEPYSDDQIQGLIRAGKTFTHHAAQKYTQEHLGKAHEAVPNLPSSLKKQAPIGRTFALAATGDPEYKRRVFEQYQKHAPEHVGEAKDYDELLNKAYGQLGHETHAQFNSLPVNMSFHKNGEGNYSSSKQMLNDIYNNHHMYVYQGGEPHEHLHKVDPETGLSQNDMFRAVHDFYGHALNGAQFGPHGEEKAWAEHSSMFSPLARMALTAETRGQNSFVNYTPINSELKQNVARQEEAAYEARRRGMPEQEAKHLQNKRDLMSNFQFAPQKSVLLPPEMNSGQYAGGVPEYLRDLIKPKHGTHAELTHYSHEPNLRETDPTKYGTGIKGREATRLAQPGAVKKRTYFYEGEPRQKETGLGVNKYKASVPNLYDSGQDPAKLMALAQESNRNPANAKSNPGMINYEKAYSDMERLAKEHGYNGVINRSTNSPMAAVFGPTSVEKEIR